MQLNSVQSELSFEASPKIELLRIAKLQEELVSHQKVMKVHNREITYDRKKITTYAKDHSPEEVLSKVERIRTNMVAALQKEKASAQSDVDRLGTVKEQVLYRRRKKRRDIARRDSADLAFQICHPRKYTNWRNVNEFLETKKEELTNLYPDLQKTVRELTVSFHQARVKKLEKLIDFVTNYRKPQEAANSIK